LSSFFPTSIGHLVFRCIHQQQKFFFSHKSISILAVKSHLSSSSSSIDTNIDAPDSSNVLFRSPLFGDLRRIRLSDNDEEDTFLEKMGVPVFSASINTENNCANIVVDLITDPSLKKKKKRRGLEGVINHGPAFVVDNILTSKACEQIVSDCEKMNFGSFASGKNLHSAMQIIVEPYMAEAIAKQLAPHIDLNELETLRREMILKGKSNDNDYIFDDTRLFFVGLNVGIYGSMMKYLLFYFNYIYYSIFPLTELLWINFSFQCLLRFS